MLFTDSDLLTAADLVALDPEAPDVAAAEGLIVEGDGSILRQAWEECADEALGRMEAFGGRLVAHAGGGQVSRVALSQIVATDAYARKLSVLQRWVLYRALVLFYRAATSRALNDRHALKMAQYMADAASQWRALWRRGLPVVWQPLPCPGAVHEWGAGEWTPEHVSSVPAASSADMTLQVAITWVDGSRYQSPGAKGNAESGPSRVVAFVLPADERLKVSIAGLQAPAGAARLRAPGEAQFGTMTATGWNIYAGMLAGPLWLQNAAPVPVGQIEYTLPDVPLLGGEMLEPGQAPDVHLAWQNVLQRG
jgi:hypothetical protein